jgi:2-hydroxy-3-oxopropionate reductase
MGAVAVLGLGLMGMPMARRLAEAHGPVAAWNRSPVALAEKDAPGLAVAGDPTQVASAADVVVTMLTDGAAVADVLFARGVARAMRPGALVIDMSSIAPDEARDHARRLAALGLRHLDAPVSGGTAGAEAGTLAIMVGGAAEDFARAQAVFAPLGRAVHLGPSGAGQVAKLANQIIVALTIGGVAEGLALARAGGVDPARFVDAIGGGLAGSTVLARYAPRMIAGDFAARGRSSLHLKDIRNALRHAASLGLELPLSGTVERLFAELIGRHGDVDHCGLILAIAKAGAAAVNVVEERP